MTTRQRVLNILDHQKADRLPAVYFGFWYELLLEWEEQGHIPKGFAGRWGDGNDADWEIMAMLGVEYNWGASAGPAYHLFPAFEQKEIGKTPDGFVLWQNGDGVIEKVKEGAHGIPGEHDYLLKDRESFVKYYKDRLQYSDDRVNLNKIKAFYDKHPKDAPIGINCGSLFGNIRNMLTVMGMSYMLADDYELLAEICDIYGDIAYKALKKVLEFAAQNNMVYDYAHFWEDICFKNGPLLSPSMFDELTAHNYKKVSDLLKSYGIKYTSLDCDGVIGALTDTWVNNGINIMFPIEIGVWGDQFESLREKYGKELRGVGAMDKTVLRQDKAAVDKELERIKRLKDLGGYIPCPDHRLMPGTKWELARYYFDRIKQL